MVMKNQFNRAIIFGSNFGFNTHYRCLKKFFKFEEISICSPNIRKKKFKVSKKFENYNLALKKEYDFVSISTPPLIQKKICKLILKKKNKPKYLVLEKPICENYKETKMLIKKLNKSKINYFVNFIYVNIDKFKEFKKRYGKNKILISNYEWTFKQAYFVNKKKTWKIRNNKGGGLINYYLIHVFYNLLFFFKTIKINSVKLNKKNGILTECKIRLNINSNFVMNIYMNINSNKNIHKINFQTKNSKYELLNKSRDWVNGFKIYKNNKIIKSENLQISRNQLTALNYLKIKNKKERKTNNNMSKKAHELCEVVNNFG